jgi:copper transport protein
VTRTLAFLVVLAAALGLAMPTHAWAHSELVRSSVGAGEVRLTFSVPVEQASARVELRNADARVINGEPHLDPDDPNTLVATITSGQQGVGPVSWAVLSRDGHVTRSGDIGSAWGDTAAAIGRVLILAGLIAMTGLVVLRWWVVGAAWQAGGLVPPGRVRGDDEFRARSEVALTAVVGGWGTAWRVARSGAAVGLALLITGTAVGLGVGFREKDDLLGSSRLGVLVVVVLATVVVAGWGEGVLRRRQEAPVPSPPNRWGGLLVALPALGLVAMSWSGHASTDSDAAVSIVVDAIHNLATAAWIGGLIGLIVLLLPAGARLDATDRLRLVAPGIVRFSTVATICVAALVVTGTYRALAAVGSFGDLVDTTYGVALVAKLGVFALMLVVGGYNRIVLHTRLERAVLGLDADDRDAATALGRSVRAELVLAGAVLVAVGVLLGTPPPR